MGHKLQLHSNALCLFSSSCAAGFATSDLVRHPYVELGLHNDRLDLQLERVSDGSESRGALTEDGMAKSKVGQYIND